MDSWPLADITQSTNYPNYSVFQWSYSSQSLMDHKIAFSEISGKEPWAYILCWSAMTEKCLYTMKGSIIIFICKHFYVAHRNYTAYLAIFKQKKNKTKRLNIVFSQEYRSLRCPQRASRLQCWGMADRRVQMLCEATKGILLVPCWWTGEAAGGRRGCHVSAC